MRHSETLPGRAGLVLTLVLALLLATSRPASAQDDTLGGWRPPDLIEAVASFGAVGLDGALYVYGGHVGRVHVHSLENISPGFRRLVLDAGATWEELARGPRLQGAVLVSDGAAVYRVGGFSAANATVAEPAVLHSSRSVARYSAAEDRWEALPDMPAGRSSHDAVVAGGVLYVVGGWDMRGPGHGSAWADTVLALDLNGDAVWREIPAPFSRRALAAGARDGRIYALGGLAPQTGPVSRVDVLDPETVSADYGTLGGNHGVGNSVLLTDDAVVILLTRRTYSYLLAVDPRTGETVWKTDREPGVAWSTPVLAPDGDEIVVSASGRIEGFDAGTGDLRWSFAGFRGNHVPSPTVTGDLVIIGGMAVEANLALRRGRTGALDRSDVAWTAGSASNFASPFAYRDCVYWVNPAGAARCLAPDSGTVRWTHRLPASTWATPLGHGDRVYFFTEQGVTQVLRYSIDAPEVLATNRLSVDAPVTGFAAVDDAIVIRAGTEVIRVGRSSD